MDQPETWRVLLDLHPVEANIPKNRVGDEFDRVIAGNIGKLTPNRVRKIILILHQIVKPGLSRKRDDNVGAVVNRADWEGRDRVAERGLKSISMRAIGIDRQNNLRG